MGWRAKKVGIFRSKLEQRISLWLDSICVDWAYEPVAMQYVVPEKKRKYTPDFVIDPVSLERIKKIKDIKDLEGKIIIEAKGRLTLEDRTKMVCVKNSHPDLDIRFIFSYDNYVSPKGRKAKNGMKYSDWCTANGFPYHIGAEPPKSWFKVDGK